MSSPSSFEEIEGEIDEAAPAAVGSLLHQLERGHSVKRHAAKFAVEIGHPNEFVTDHSNVLKLFRVLDNAPHRQVAHYHPGLGTMEAIGAFSSISRKVTGFGAHNRVWTRARNHPRIRFSNAVRS